MTKVSEKKKSQKKKSPRSSNFQPEVQGQIGLYETQSQNEVCIFFFKDSFSVLSWNSLCRIGWYRTQRSECL